MLGLKREILTINQISYPERFLNFEKMMPLCSLRSVLKSESKYGNSFLMISNIVEENLYSDFFNKFENYLPSQYEISSVPFPRNRSESIKGKVQRLDLFLFGQASSSKARRRF